MLKTYLIQRKKRDSVMVEGGYQ